VATAIWRCVALHCVACADTTDTCHTCLGGNARSSSSALSTAVAQSLSRSRGRGACCVLPTVPVRTRLTGRSGFTNPTPNGTPRGSSATTKQCTHRPHPGGTCCCPAGLLYAVCCMLYLWRAVLYIVLLRRYTTVLAAVSLAPVLYIVQPGDDPSGLSVVTSSDLI
jgi:hypothetical protein